MRALSSPAFPRPIPALSASRGRAGAVAALLALLCCPGVARAETRSVPLAPPNASMTLEAHGLGLFPIDIAIQRFSGTLRYDPTALGRCAVELTAEAASAHTSDPARQARLQGPDFLDAARHPTFTFAGRCMGANELSGTLTLRGIARPFVLRLDWNPKRLNAEGRLVRAQWGMTAMPVMLGPGIDVTITAKLP